MVNEKRTSRVVPAEEVSGSWIGEEGRETPKASQRPRKEHVEISVGSSYLNYEKCYICMNIYMKEDG